MGGSRLSQRKSIVRPSLSSQPDLIIATTALHHGLTIVTRNLSDDQRVRTPVFNPRVEDYVLDWDLPANLEAVNEHIRQQGLLALRRPIRSYFQWVGALMPALVWTRPAVVFGNTANNRLIADIITPRPPEHTTHWVNWRRRHQARSRWFHKRTTLARNIENTQVN